MTHFFENITLAPPDAIFGLQAAFQADPRKNKINLSIGVYKDRKLATPILHVVKKVEEDLLHTEKSKEYLPIDGDKRFLEHSGKLVFGEGWNQRIAAVQSVGGTGGLRIGGDFLQQAGAEEIYIPQPTWPNHPAIFKRCRLKVAAYPYYDKEKRKIDLSSLEKIPEGSVVLLHACCHNPTGADPTDEEWKNLSQLFLKRKLFPFFDFAYQGFGRGLEEDARAVRLFSEAGHEMLVASSYAKNFGLYAERVGVLYAVTKTTERAHRVQSQLKTLIRSNYSNPPKHGAMIVGEILASPALKKMWEEELEGMRSRIGALRELFVKKTGFDFLKDRYGMFSFCDLTEAQVKRLMEEFAIYMTGDGRINIAGLNEDNLTYVAESIVQVKREKA